jgi:hypothetical protein
MYVSTHTIIIQYLFIKNPRVVQKRTVRIFDEHRRGLPVIFCLTRNEIRFKVTKFEAIFVVPIHLLCK